MLHTSKNMKQIEKQALCFVLAFDLGTQNDLGRGPQRENVAEIDPKSIKIDQKLFKIR